MRRLICVALGALALTILWNCGSIANAACPTVSCQNPGSLAPFAGTFGCTFVTTLSNGQVNASLAQVTSDGNGNITSFIETTNNNNSSGSTFTPWPTSPTFTNGTYCLNSDQSGYITPPPSFGCPFAIFVDITGFEVRLMDSSPNTAGAAVCEQE
jgi:hypothetical protein